VVSDYVTAGEMTAADSAAKRFLLLLHSGTGEIFFCSTPHEPNDVDNVVPYLEHFFNFGINFLNFVSKKHPL